MSESNREQLKTRLAALEAAFEKNGGRGVEEAEEIEPG